MVFNPNIPVLAVVLFAAALICVVYIVVVYGGRLRAVRRRRAEDDSVSGYPDVLPQTSVVVYSPDDGSLCEDDLRPLLQQDFPGAFEVIVVNDGTPHEADLVVTRLKREVPTYPNLYLTFAPEGGKGVSRKKLAITIGVKAARGRVVVVTDSLTRICSDKWLTAMVTPFADKNVEVVLGYNTPLIPESGYAGRLVSAFDAAADAVTWLSSAIAGRPYRGCASNMAFLESVFFANKGFSRSLNMKHGVDDIFVSEIANSSNTRVAIPTVAIGKEGREEGRRKQMVRERAIHAFTGRKLGKLPRGLMAAGEWMMGLVVILSLAGALACGLGNAYGWIFAGVLIVGTVVYVVAEWRRVMVSLGFPALMFTLPFLVATRPLRNVFVRLKSLVARGSNYTWQA